MIKQIIGKLRFMRYNHISYDFWWETESVELWENADDDCEEPIIEKQDYIHAKEIDCDFYGEIDFPWHGYTMQDFLDFDAQLQGLIPVSMGTHDKKSVLRLKRKYKSLYEAYFLAPIQVLEESNGNGKRYKIMGDGRHRIWAAQQHNGLLPVWIVRYERAKKISLDCYRKCCAIGEWRFFERT